jgi:hypothetical protein
MVLEFDDMQDEKRCEEAGRTMVRKKRARNIFDEGLVVRKEGN